MPVPTTIADLNVTESLNSPAGSESIGTSLDNYIRAHAAIIKQHEADLASAASASKGAGLLGLALTLAYGAGTVGGFLRGLNHISKYGTVVSDGTTDDAATFQAAAASGDVFIDARGVNCKIGSAITGASNQMWLLQGATLRIASSTMTLFDYSAKTNFALSGPFNIIGDGSTVGTAKAIRISDCSRWRVDAPTISSIKGWGIYLEPGSSTTLRSDHGVISNPRIDQCYIGYQDVAGTGSEYCTLENPHITRCTISGLTTATGNLRVVGGHIVDNLQDGVTLNNGSNHSHGGFVGTNINHNVRYNVVANQVTNGETFIGCHIYANNAAGQGAIFLDRCKGIIFDGGHLDCWVYNDKDGSSGQNIIRNMYCPGGYGDIQLLPGPNPGTDQLWFQDCYGAGAYTAGVSINDPAPVYLYAQRAAGATQSVGSGTVLIFPTETFDRRLAYNNTTGVFTAPTGQAGTYEISADLVFGGTALDSTASYIELRYNTTVVGLYLLGHFGTTLLTASVKRTIYLNAGDTLKLEATVSGTTPTFGHATYAPTLDIRRVA